MSFLVVANWKTCGSVQLVYDFLSAFGRESPFDVSTNQVVLCPPLTATPLLAEGRESKLKFGAQNCFLEGKNCTGEVTPSMLKECGYDYVIVGHSERRSMMGESNSDVKAKAESVQDAGMIPIICIGETLREREEGMLEEALLEQCKCCFPEKGEFIVGYEPVWAIGGSAIPSLDSIEESFRIIKSHSMKSKIIYGGSVNEGNICSLRTGISDLGGVLIGSASTKLDSFTKILHNLSRCL